jgi:serine/threonine protein kinase
MRTEADSEQHDATNSRREDAASGAGHVPIAAGDVLTWRGGLEDRYSLREERGRGGLGRVVEAFDGALGRVVAIKQLLRYGPLNEARFAREARITARLQHPSIVPVYDAGYSSTSGAPFYAMKLVSGRTLEELIRERAHAPLSARLPLLTNVIAVTDAVAYAHSRGVIHRDLKGTKCVDDPELDVESDGALDATTNGMTLANSVTAAGAVLGTPEFMAPEQARGEPVDARADVYALGAILYYVLAGKTPFAETEASRILELGRKRTRPVRIRARCPEVPRDLAAIVERALAVERDDRYPNAAHFGDDLRRFQAGQQVTAHRYSVGERLGQLVRRHIAVTLATAF